MGDPARFAAFADAIQDRWPDRDLRIADVAGGKGALRAELYTRGYRRVKVVDRRRGKTHRDHYLYGRFTDHYPDAFQVVVGMHPDQATDQIVAYATRRRVPFAVVPCCVMPSAFAFDGPRHRSAWVRHLAEVAAGRRFDVVERELPIWGANRLLIGTPR